MSVEEEVTEEVAVAEVATGEVATEEVAREEVEDPFSPEERANIEALKAHLTEEEKREAVVDDFYIYRFLEARAKDPEKGAEMLKKHLVWRRENDIDSVLEKGPPPKYHMLKDGSFVHKEDRDGNPVAYWMCGVFFSDMSKIYTPEEYMKVTIYDSERSMKLLQDLSRERNKLARVLIVGDVTGITASASKAQRLARPVTLLLADNYPEMILTSIGVNVPWIATMLWNVFKRFIDPNVVRKTELYSDLNYDALVKHIAPENIPKRYGGLCECPGGCLPMEYLERGLAGKLAEGISLPRQLDMKGEDMDLKEVTIYAGKTHIEEVHTSVEGGEFTWFFRASSDVDFSVTFHKRSGESKEVAAASSEASAAADKNDTKEHTLHELERVPKDMPITGSFPAPEAGHCRFFWSNEFSVFRSKTIKLYVKYGDP